MDLTLDEHEIPPHLLSCFEPSEPVKPPAKSLLLMPFRVALALQRDGWILRQRIEWCKTAPLPESVKDRPTTATEPIFLFVKQPKYFYDSEAIRQPALHEGRVVKASGNGAKNAQSVNNTYVGFTKHDTTVNGANLRNYLLLGPSPSREPHFASFPSAIPRIAILAGTSDKGVCRACGAPWVRVVESEIEHTQRIHNGTKYNGERQHGNAAANRHFDGHVPGVKVSRTTGWAASCACRDAGDAVPATVLDPFLGSGTTARVAEALGRSWIGVELLPAYVEMAERRTAQRGLFQHAADQADQGQEVPIDDLSAD